MKNIKQKNIYSTTFGVDPKILGIEQKCNPSLSGTRDGTRTRTAVKPADFKSAASTIPPPELKFNVASIQIFLCKSKIFYIYIFLSYLTVFPFESSYQK